MSDNVVVFFLLGVFIGGVIATLALALVASGSEQRWARLFPRADLRDPERAEKRSSPQSVAPD